MLRIAAAALGALKGVGTIGSGADAARLREGCGMARCELRPLLGMACRL